MKNDIYGVLEEGEIEAQISESYYFDGVGAVPCACPIGRP
jgi:hypothetical protein